MLAEAVTLTVIGMTVVFAFLILLVVTMSTLSFLVRRFSPVVEGPVAGGSSMDLAVAVAVAFARAKAQHDSESDTE